MSIETFFNGRLDAPHTMGLVQNEFAEEFPVLMVPKVPPGESTALRPVQLRNDSHSHSLALAYNQVSYVCFDYPGHQEFIPAALAVINRSLEIMGVTDLNRLVYRYDNRYEVSDDGVLPVEVMFDVSFPAWMGSQDFRDLDVRFQSGTAEGFVEGRVAAAPGPTPDTARIAAQIGAGVEDLPVSRLPDQVSNTHASAVATFEQLITDEFREVLRGNSDG